MFLKLSRYFIFLFFNFKCEVLILLDEDVIFVSLPVFYLNKVQIKMLRKNKIYKL